MKVVEYGTQHQETILLLHGGGLNGWNYQQAAQQLSGRYHVVLPTLDGHAGSDVSFTTIENNADEIIRWVDTHCAGQVLLMGGLSLGGQILVDILSRRADICRYAVIESALVFPMKWTAAMIRPAYNLCYPLIRKRWFARLQFWSLHIRPDLFDVYFADTAAISKENMTAFLEANARYRLKESLAACRAKTLVLAGSKELPIMKRSAKAIAERMPHASLEVLPGYVHGELSLNHPEAYVNKLLSLLEE